MWFLKILVYLNTSLYCQYRPHLYLNSICFCIFVSVNFYIWSSVYGHIMNKKKFMFIVWYVLKASKTKLGYCLNHILAHSANMQHRSLICLTSWTLIWMVVALGMLKTNTLSTLKGFQSFRKLLFLSVIFLFLSWILIFCVVFTDDLFEIVITISLLLMQNRFGFGDRILIYWH